jgi:ATP-dependent Clp protease adaptor protein ClpS
MIYETKEEDIAVLEDVALDDHQVVLYNDDVNTFDFVIELLVKYCKHEALQAEQCAMLVHYKGRCVVKKGGFDKMKSIHEKLSSSGLTAELE